MNPRSLDRSTSQRDPQQNCNYTNFHHGENPHGFGGPQAMALGSTPGERSSPRSEFSARSEALQGSEGPRGAKLQEGATPPAEGPKSLSVAPSCSVLNIVVHCWHCSGPPVLKSVHC